ncbi:ABC transporter permease [Marinoscillum sp.]|uniref:ABC transporter permease n=1 Tax=Marinoscillum sp. TaxID=2024838 RepID=UPI003BA9936C
MTNKTNHTDPPQWAMHFLHWYCKPELLEDLEGDLLELYDRKVEAKGVRAANRLFTWLVLRSFRWSAIKKNHKLKTQIPMITGQNFKVAARVLWRDKFNTFLNVLGLTIGILCFVQMGLYVAQELSFDHMHTKKDRIYRTYLYEDYGDGRIFFNSVTPIRFEPLFEAEFPEFQSVVQRTERTFAVTKKGENWINESVAVVSPDFFEVFDFELIHGNTNQPLQGRYDLIISEDYAQKYFGRDNPVGETLTFNINEEETAFTITAVSASIPENSSIQFDLVISNELNKTIFGEGALTGWTSVSQETFVLVSENASIKTVNEKSQDVLMSYLGEDFERDQYTIGFQPLTDIHLNPEIPAGIAPVSNPTYVYVLGIIGFLVLLIACVNYTTLSIGKSIKRAKEVGMRKILGAGKKLLVGQYLTESILIALVSMVIGTVIAILSIPTFNRLTGVSLVYDFAWWHVGLFLLIGLLIGTLAGLYPSFVLTNIRIMTIMQSSNTSGGKHWVRKVMVTFQFLVTVLLISSTLIMKKQIGYLQSKDLGYEYEAVISVPLFAEQNGRFVERYMSAQNNARLLQQNLEKHPELTNFTTSSHAFGTNGWMHLAFEDIRGNFLWFRLLGTDADFVESFDLKVVEGRNFESDNTADERQSILLNETAVKYFGLENPLEEKLPGADFGEHRIIGVVEDFHYSSLHEEIEPLVITQSLIPVFQGISDADFTDSPIPKLLFKYTGTQLTTVNDILQEEWKRTFPNRNLDYEFMDENIARQYENEARLNKLIGVATLISIVIASIGLLGLTVLVVNSREKEIGIRKVIGASPAQIFGLLAKTFSWQLALGVILSIPLTIWLMGIWLEDFAYRVSIGVDMFVVSTLLSVVIALLVISYHSWKATRINPVKSLRAE